MILKEIRTKKNLSQNQLARLCNISQSYISELEGGKHEATETVIIKLCVALKVDPNSLLNFVAKGEDVNGTDAVRKERTCNEMGGDLQNNRKI